MEMDWHHGDQGGGSPAVVVWRLKVEGLVVNESMICALYTRQ